MGAVFVDIDRLGRYRESGAYLNMCERPENPWTKGLTVLMKGAMLEDMLLQLELLCWLKNCDIEVATFPKANGRRRSGWVCSPLGN
jgi:hypothetical protein